MCSGCERFEPPLRQTIQWTNPQSTEACRVGAFRPSKSSRTVRSRSRDHGGATGATVVTPAPENYIVGAETSVPAPVRTLMVMRCPARVKP